MEVERSAQRKAQCEYLFSWEREFECAFDEESDGYHRLVCSIVRHAHVHNWLNGFKEGTSLFACAQAKGVIEGYILGECSRHVYPLPTN